MFPTLGGAHAGSAACRCRSASTSQKRPDEHAINVNFTRSTSTAINRYAYRRRRRRRRRHQRRLDGSVRLGRADALVLDVLESARHDADATIGSRACRRATRGRIRCEAHTYADWRRRPRRTGRTARPTRTRAATFVFTGLYAAGGGARSRAVPASTSPISCSACRSRRRSSTVPGTSSCAGARLSAYLQDDWRKSGNLTFNLGVRYELIWPYTETDGQMVNLDVNDRFTAVAPVLSGETGPFTGAYPGRARQHRRQQHLAALRRRVARRSPATIVRGGYGIDLQRRLVRDDRATARRAAAVCHHQHQSGHAPPIRSRWTDPFVDRVADHHHQQLRHRSQLRPRHDPDVERGSVARR